jgi:hypothetical protein
MEWVLILWTYWPDSTSASPVVAEFHSEQACLAAVKAVEAQSTFGQRVRGVCTPKGEDQ